MKLLDIKLLNYFRPSLFVNNINDIIVDDLYNRGFRMVICDLDNTLVPHFTKFPTKMAFDFVKKIRNQGIIFVVVSNNTKKRVTRFCELLKPDDFVYNARKPFLKKTSQMIKKYNISCDDILFIGDQIITDIWISNRLKCKSILTLPIVDSVGKNTNFFVNLIDKYLYRYLQHNNLLNSKKELENNESYELL
ncbi:MAG: HAD-IIIA family hydrolase [Ureaplasma sp.]|nr:HAD-IIIA family hydrolase [Ureaplasma sp.]